MATFINITNHPLSQWGEGQRKAAGFLNGVEGREILFPNVLPNASSEEIANLARGIVSSVQAIGEPASEDVGVWGVHVMGEQTLCFALVSELLKLGYNVLASTTERRVVETPTGKISQFEFVKFRRYAVIPIPPKAVDAASAANAWGGDGRREIPQRG